MLIIIGSLFIAIGVTTVWFNIPYSQVKREFQKDNDFL